MAGWFEEAAPGCGLSKVEGLINTAQCETYLKHHLMAQLQADLAEPPGLGMWKEITASSQSPMSHPATLNTTRVISQTQPPDYWHPWHSKLQFGETMLRHLRKPIARDDCSLLLPLEILRSDLRVAARDLRNK